MTINVRFADVVESISNFSISGVNIRDVNTIPENAMDMCPIFFPRPDGMVTDIIFTRVTLGSDGSALMDMEYTLNYRFLYAEIGSGDVLANYTGLIEKLALICKAIFTNDTPSGAVDMQLQSISNIGPLPDPVGMNVYHGVDIALRVLEHIQ